MINEENLDKVMQKEDYSSSEYKGIFEEKLGALPEIQYVKVDNS